MTTSVDYTKDTCDFCERVVQAGHVCEKMPIERVIGGYEDGSLRYPSAGYATLVACFGEILVEVSDHDYQGDTRYLLKAPDGRYGFLVNGWGSCSGCDALEACSSATDYDKLRNDLGAGVKWFDTAEDVTTYFNTKDWETEYYGRGDEMQRFLVEARAALLPSDTKEST